jgi:glycine/D-amino acid oxidase-like deaminating enzyme
VKDDIMGSETNGSLWAATAAPSDTAWPALQGDLQADVVVVGGGYTGCAAALAAASTGARVVLVEAHDIGWGASGRTGGQVIPGLKYDPDEIEQMFGTELGSRLVAAVGSVGDEVFGLIDEHRIECEATRKGWLQPAISPRTLDVVQQRCEQWARRGAPVALVDRARIAELIGTDRYLGGWEDSRAGHVQPLSFNRGLAEAAQRAGAEIFIRSAAQQLAKVGGRWKLRAGKGSVIADTVIIGTNGYTDALWPGLARTVVPMISMQAATERLPTELGGRILPAGHCASDTRRLLWYFRRDAAGRLLMGGRAPFRENLGPKDAINLRIAVDTLFPQLRGVPFRYHWGGRVAMTKDHLPHLHQLAPGVWTALGYNGRGVGLAPLLGRFLAQLAAGTRAGDIPFPVTAMRPILGYPFTRTVARALVRYYRMRDKLEVG